MPVLVPLPLALWSPPELLARLEVLRLFAPLREAILSAEKELTAENSEVS
jgi:hypothetical protein